MARNKYPEQTVRRILEAAARLFAQKGYEKTSLQDIIDDTGLSKGAIYHHFASKEDIFLRICEHIGRENAAVLGAIRDDKRLNGAEKLKEIFRTAILHPNQERILGLVPYLLDSPKFLAMQIQEIFEEAVPHYITPILAQGIADGSIKTAHPAELSEALMVLSDIWLHPLLRPTSSEAMRARCAVFIQITRGVGLNLLDEEMVNAFVSYSQLLEKQRRERG